MTWIKTAKLIYIFKNDKTTIKGIKIPFYHLIIRDTNSEIPIQEAGCGYEYLVDFVMCM